LLTAASDRDSQQGKEIWGLENVRTVGRRKENSTHVQAEAVLIGWGGTTSVPQERWGRGYATGRDYQKTVRQNCGSLVSAKSPEKNKKTTNKPTPGGVNPVSLRLREGDKKIRKKVSGRERKERRGGSI